MAYVKKTREEKETEVKALIENTEKKISQYFESPENIKEYLSFMSKFYNYSLNNSILIDNQFSGAVGVGSYAFWKQKGFKINKGEKGIKILVPQIGTDNFRNEKGEIKSVDKATKEENLKIKNKEFEVKKGRIHFGQGYIFDVSQTNAKAQDLPNIFPNKWLEGSIKNYSDLYKGMEKIAKNIGVKIVEPNQEMGVAKGVSYTTLKEIALNPRNTELQNVKTLLHELTHAKLHTMEKLNKYQTHEKEFQAELIAYTVCSHFGIDTSEYSLKYIHDWTEGRTLKDKKELLREVRETSIEYIETLEEVLINKKEIQEPVKEEIYKTTEVSKIDNTKEKFHIYQFNNEPEKCFLGQKVDNTIKKLGAIATLGLVKTQFKEFKEFEKNNTNTLTKGKTEIQEKVTMLVQELKL
ncbi:ImmA/IrrE family metallo-endopeptidase [uncultured Clostridium sp.]|uniref:ImmA/IrrE family metallo-endopeptidase n=1 Tax=uncultured Clostridium sp. TaxID=59620 RepID=UPI002636E512|nr:ImmA/IrrE family metallo-endopeptidase [uncultured Clostridium sp.]